jgi:hypothetical protein
MSVVDSITMPSKTWWCFSHTSSTISGWLSSAIPFGGWVQARGLHFVDIDDNTIKAFCPLLAASPGSAPKSATLCGVRHAGTAKAGSEFSLRD